MLFFFFFFFSMQKYAAWFASAHHGVVLFSLGYTGFEAKDVPVAVLREILTAFAQLKQKVIMRFSKEFIPFTPDNVLVEEWLPQQDILGKQLLRKGTIKST